MDNINFKKVLDDGELFDQQANYEENFEKINQEVVPKITDLETNKVDKVTGKGLSTNDYTTTEKNKLAGIPADTATQLSGKVDKVTGKGLSTNDFDNTYKQKIDVDIPAQLAEKANKTLRWSEVTGTSVKLNFDTVAKTITLPTNVYVFNDDGYRIANAGTIPYTDANATYVCVNKNTGALFVKDFTTVSTEDHYVLCRIQAGKIFSPFGYKNINVNGAAITGANTDQVLVVGENSLDNNSVSIAKLKMKKWAELLVTVNNQKLNVNTVAKTVTLTSDAFAFNDDGYRMAVAQTINYNDANSTFICMNRSTGALFAQDITQPTTAYAFVLLGISSGKIFCPFGYKYILVNGQKIKGEHTNFELPDNSVTKNNLAFDISGKRKYTLADAWNAWKKGEKFPVAIIGDSTTESTTDPIAYNTLGTDHKPAGAYPTVLEALIRQSTGSTVARIYNAGFSSRNAVWSLANIDALIKNNVNYADAKLIGIRHGLNDPLENAVTVEYIDTFRNAMRGIIDWCILNGYQPFLITPQATMIAFPKYSRPGYTSAETTNISLSVIRELAEEYNLELVDNYTYTKMLQLNVENIQALCADGLHYKSEGHKYQAEYLFSEFNKEVIKIDKAQKIGYNNPEVRSEIGECSKATSKTDGFNSYITTTASGKVFKVNLFNHFKYGVTLNFFFSSVGDMTVRVNGIDYMLNTSNKVIVLSGMGLMQIEVVNTEGNTVTFYGLEITQ